VVELAETRGLRHVAVTTDPGAALTLSPTLGSALVTAGRAETRATASHGESSPWFTPKPTSVIGPPPQAWQALPAEEIGATRKRLADAVAAHDHEQGVGCRDLSDAYDRLARACVPMAVPEPAPMGDQPWNKP
jgi:hypothetical protein